MLQEMKEYAPGKEPAPLALRGHAFNQYGANVKNNMLPRGEQPLNL